MKCFGMAKDSEWTDVRDRNKADDIPTCYVLTPEVFGRMRRNNLCGDPRHCPFMKTSRSEVRKD